VNPDFEAIAAEVRTAVRPETARRVAIVGAGAIVDLAHLPAYRAGGLDVAGILDLDAERAAVVAARHGVPRVYRDVDELLADDDIEVVDVAVPGPAQPAIVERALRAGRHVLGQKPFAPDAATGRALADLADELGLGLAVNQQLRFDEGVAAAHAMARRGWLGDLYRLVIDVRIHTDWAAWPWLLTAPRLEIANHSIHYHDVVRWFLGEPRTVYCTAGRVPRQAAVGETSTISTYTFDSGARAHVHSDHTAPRRAPRATFEITGTTGTVRGTFGLLADYPRGGPDALEVRSDVFDDDDWLTYPVTHRWLPDAFLGPMASLLDFVAGGIEPLTSARDNVGTLEVVDALYRSQASGDAQQVGSA
jgi:predicted dehydrogenase